MIIVAMSQTYFKDYRTNADYLYDHYIALVLHLQCQVHTLEA